MPEPKQHTLEDDELFLVSFIMLALGNGILIAIALMISGLFSSPVEKMPGFRPLPHTVMPRLDFGISRYQPCGCYKTLS